MHVINKKEEIIIKFEGAKREALSSFGNNSILIEKYLQNPRHIEVKFWQIIMEHSYFIR